MLPGFVSLCEYFPGVVLGVLLGVMLQDCVGCVSVCAIIFTLLGGHVLFFPGGFFVGALDPVIFLTWF